MASRRREFRGQAEELVEKGKESVIKQQERLAEVLEAGKKPPEARLSQRKSPFACGGDSRVEASRKTPRRRNDLRRGIKQLPDGSGTESSIALRCL